MFFNITATVLLIQMISLKHKQLVQVGILS